MDTTAKDMMNMVSKTGSVDFYYSGYSINSEKVLMCFFEKGFEFDGHYIDLFKFEQTKPEYLRINPLGLVPTLVIDGTPIPESTVINEYVDDLIPSNPLRPEDPLLRAKMRELVQRFQESFYPSMALLSQFHFVAGELKRRWTNSQLEEMIRRKPLRERRERQERALQKGLSEADIANAERNAITMLDRMDAHLSNGSGWLLGEFSLADIAAVPNVHRFFQLGLGDAVETRFHVMAWYRRIKERPSFVRTYEYAVQDFS